MARLLRMTEIGEFAKAGAVPEAAIGEDVLRNTGALGEREHLEPWLRELLRSHGNTPHGPTEIADILTTHVTVSGRRRYAAFILKGRGTRVTAKEVSHQILRLTRLDGLEVAVLVAVGNIQDDAYEHFVGVAKQTGSDFLVIDRTDVARLFVAYAKVCGQDGLPFTNGCCPNGHLQMADIELRYRVREEQEYQVVSVQDVSHGLQRRLSAKIIADPHYPQDTIRDIIRDAVDQIRQDRFYATDLLRRRWEGTPAHVVWVFVAADLADVAHSNYLCGAQWVDASLPKSARPGWFDSAEMYNGIAIDWHSDYHQVRTLMSNASGTKADVIESVEAILSEALPLVRKARESFLAYQNGATAEDAHMATMKRTLPAADELYDRAGRSPMPPFECKDYEQCFQNIMSHFHTLWLVYTEPEFFRRDPGNRGWLFAEALKHIDTRLVELRQERDRLSRG